MCYILVSVEQRYHYLRTLSLMKFSFLASIPILFHTHTHGNCWKICFNPMFGHIQQDRIPEVKFMNSRVSVTRRSTLVTDEKIGKAKGKLDKHTIILVDMDYNHCIESHE